MDAAVSEGLPWWLWFFVVLLLVALAIWLWLCLRKRLRAAPLDPIAADAVADESPSLDVAEPVASFPLAAADQAPDARPGVEEEPVPMAPATAVPTVPDDLERIEGIGPKIASLFQAAGISTFAQLAATDVDRLREILAEAKLNHLADPATWPEQAKLAADARWDDLVALQSLLKGGRRS